MGGSGMLAERTLPRRHADLLTADHVAISTRQAQPGELTDIDTQRAKEYPGPGPVQQGSMEPKVRTAKSSSRNRGRVCIIGGSLDRPPKAMAVPRHPHPRVVEEICALRGRDVAPRL